MRRGENPEYPEKNLSEHGPHVFTGYTLPLLSWHKKAGEKTVFQLRQFIRWIGTYRSNHSLNNSGQKEILSPAKISTERKYLRCTVQTAGFINGSVEGFTPLRKILRPGVNRSGPKPPPSFHKNLIIARCGLPLWFNSQWFTLLKKVLQKPIRYVTIQDRSSAASPRHKTRSKIGVLHVCERKPYPLCFLCWYKSYPAGCKQSLSYIPALF